MSLGSLVVATRNPGKIREMRAFLSGLDVEVTGLDGFPGLGPVSEDGETFVENALIKARSAVGHTGLPALADDSGLEVDALGGRPGIHSARFSGPAATDEDNNALLLKEMEGVPAGQRLARYRAAVALVLPGDGEFVREAASEGEILTAPRGEGGFGYDPLFYVPERDRTFAELDPAEREAVSHRFRALRALRPVLDSLFRG